MSMRELRERIDGINDEILQLFLERMAISEEIAAEKQRMGLPLVDRERESAILAEVQKKAGDMEVYAYHLFSKLIALSKARQSELAPRSTKLGEELTAILARPDEVFPQSGAVACQGVEGSNAQAACYKMIPRGQIMYLRSFRAVFDVVESGLCRFGVLPIENSSNGSVRAVYELLREKRCHIVRSTSMRIPSDIQDSDNNYTRFICIERDPVVYAGANKTSLILSCDNRPGALCDILSILSVHGVNMSKLESSPAPSGGFDFIFFLEMDAGLREPGIAAMLEELDRECAGLTLLGSYSAV